MAALATRIAPSLCVSHGLLALLVGFLLSELYNGAYSGGLFLLFGVGAVMAETLSYHYPDFGYGGAAHGLYLGLALHPQLGSPEGGFLLLLGVLVRTVVRSRRPTVDLAEALSSITLGWLWLLTLEFVSDWPVGWLAISVSYLWLVKLAPSLWVDEKALWKRIRRDNWPYELASLSLGWLASQMADPEFLLALFVVLAVLQGAMFRLVSFREVTSRQILESRLNRQQSEARRLERELQAAQKSGAYREETATLLARTVQALKGTDKPRQAFQIVLQLASEICTARSMVFFRAQEDGLQALLWESPAAESRFSEKKGEPLCEAAWRENKPLILRKETWPPRLLAEEKSVAAVPVEGLGVLYLGRLEERFQAFEVRQLWVMARQASVVLSKILKEESQSRAFAYVSREHRKLSLWVHRLNVLLEGSRKLATADSTVEILSITGELAQQLIPHEKTLWLHFTSNGRWESSDLSPSLAQGLAAECHRSGLLSLQGRLVESQIQSALALKLQLAQPIILVLTSSVEEQFNKEHLNLLALLLQQTSTALQVLELKEKHAEDTKMAALGQIAAGLSHEMNTPLASIRLGVESAVNRMEQDVPAAKRLLQEAVDAVAEMTTVLEGLLFYVTSYGVAEPDRVDLTALLRKEMEQFPHGKFHGLFPAVVAGHSLDLEQMLRHLLRNAVEASQRERRKGYDIRMKQDGEWVLLEIEDQGSGIAEEIRTRIFDPFFTTKDVGQGLGLGLSVSRRIAEMHHGTLQLMPHQKGAIFQLRLPLYQKPPEREEL